MQLVIFCSLFLAWPSVNFDVCSIAFVTYLLNSVPFSIFVLIGIVSKFAFTISNDSKITV